MVKKTYRNWDENGTALYAAGARSAIDDLLTAANDGDKQALHWIRRLERYGPTASLLRDLAKPINHIQLTASLEVVEDREKLSFRWRHEPPEHWTLNPELYYAGIFIYLLGIGALDGLKRCSLKECRKYFVGNAKAVWCSDKCGSKYRARRMRKRNKERQML